MTENDWKKVAESLEKRWKESLRYSEYLEKVLEKTSAELAKIKYKLEQKEED
jgi:hypothetical protein